MLRGSLSPRAGTEKKKGSDRRKSIGQVYFESKSHAQEAQIKVGALGQWAESPEVPAERADRDPFIT